MTSSLQRILELEREHGQRRFHVSRDDYIQIRHQARQREDKLTDIRKSMPTAEKTRDNPAYQATIVEPHLEHDVNFENFTDLPCRDLSKREVSWLDWHFGLQHSENARIFFYENIHPFLPKHVEELAKRRVVATRDLSGHPIRDIFVASFDDPGQRMPNDFYDIWDQEQIDYTRMKCAIEDAFLTTGRGIPAGRAHLHLNPRNPYHEPVLTIFPTAFSPNKLTGILYKAMLQLPLFPKDWDLMAVGFQGDEIPVMVMRPGSDRYESLVQPRHVAGEYGVQLSFPRGDLLPVDPRELLQAYADVINERKAPYSLLPKSARCHR